MSLPLSCADDTPDPPENNGSGGVGDPIGIDCTPGEEVGCMCNDGRAGVQLCAPNGNELGGCMCGGPGSADTGDADSGSGSDDGPTGGGGLCGNGIVDEGEQCDDGNTRYEDACNNECIAECGQVWEETIGRADMGSSGQAVAIGPDNSITVAGRIDTDDVSELWVARYDAEGTELWSNVESGVGGGTIPAVAVDADGNALVVSSTFGNTQDIWVGMYDPDGGTLWTETHDGAAGEADVGTGAAFDADGNAIATGTARQGDGDTDLWVRKYSAAGAETWTETFGGVGNGNFSLDDGGPVATDAAGNIYAQAQIYLDFDEQDVHLLKFGPDGGAPLWDVAPAAGGPADKDLPAGVAVGADGDIVMGWAADVAVMAWRFGVMKLDADGNEIWRAASGDLFEGQFFLDALGVTESGDVGLVLTQALDLTQAAVIATLTADGTAGCNGTAALENGFVIPVGGAVGAAGQIYATGLVSETGRTQQRWISRFRGAATVAAR